MKLKNVPIRLTVEVGSTNVPLSEIENLEKDSVIELDKLAGENLILLANGRPVAECTLVAVNENYGIQIEKLIKED